MQTTQKKHISVCVCTYKRPVLLDNLLGMLVSQKTEGLFSYSVVIVDNDRTGSAENTVQKHRNRDQVDIMYAVEPVKNIALARNRSVMISRGELLALIDDDEHPEDDWLVTLFKAYKSCECSGVMGPVVPIFEDNVPDWVGRLGFFHNKSYKTGTFIDDHYWAGNALISREIFNSLKLWFDPIFGSTGGEDNEFFSRARSIGHKFIWCEESRVYSVIPMERTTLSYLIKRSLGAGTAGYLISSRNISLIQRLKFFAKTSVEICRSLMALPFCHRSERGENITQIFWLLGRILACCNIYYKHYK